MKIRIAMVVLAALGAASCTARKSLEHASVDERTSHNQLYTVSAEPVIVDEGNGWINVKVQIRSELGTDSVAFNMVVR